MGRTLAVVGSFDLTENDMKYALLDQNNMILRLADEAEKPDDPTGKGWRWVEYATLIPAPPPEYSEATHETIHSSAPPYVTYALRPPPTSVTMRQARLALLQSGMLDSVNTAVAAADEAAKITWEFSSEVHRNHPFVATLAAALNLTDAQLDDLFTLAATL